MRRQVWPDGAQNEVSAGYHWMTGAAFGETMLLARANGLALPQGYAETVEKMAEYPMYLTRPNLTAPSFNDSGGVNGTTEAALRFGSEVFGRKDMLWLLTRRREGSPPPETSRAFVDAGLYVMRSDWSDQANWLAFRGGNIGAAHMHEDRLGFDLAACGSTVLVDPGAANYKPDELRAWSLSTAAHNTAVLDGLGQCQRPRPWEERTASVRDVNFWSSSPDVDVAAARYAGPYGVEPQTLNAVHYREIHFVKPAFWVMVDAFSAAGQHTASLFFHFMPMVVDVLAKAGIVHTRRYGNPNLEVHCVGWPEGTRFTKRCGSLDPVQGWVALDGEWVPAPCVQADAPFRDQLILVTLLIPLSSGLESGFAVASPGPGRWRLETPDGPFEIALVGDSRDLSGPRATPLARASRLPR
jgi:hypothetical protein